MRISDWSSDVCSSDLRLLVEAISVMNDGFVLLDEDDRLVLCNERYRCLHPGLDEVGDLVGMSFTTILRVALAKGQIAAPLARSDPEAWIAWRLDRHRNPPEEPDRQSTRLNPSH